MLGIRDQPAGREVTMAATAMAETREAAGRAEALYPDGAAFIDGAYVPITSTGSRRAVRRSG
jgi:hypothetical protein